MSISHDEHDEHDEQDEKVIYMLNKREDGDTLYKYDSRYRFWFRWENNIWNIIKRPETRSLDAVLQSISSNSNHYKLLSYEDVLLELL